MKDDQRTIQYKKWYGYFYYHHFNSHPLRPTHQTYIACLSYIEDKGNFNIDNCGVDQAWPRIKETLRSLESDDFKVLTLITKK